MITLREYIIESSLKDIVETRNNKERKHMLELYLKHKNYSDYVNVINDMLKDPKAKSLLEDGFGGILGDMKFKFSIKKIKVSELIPSQKDIYLDKSLVYSLNDINTYNDVTAHEIKTNKPIITYNSTYIIDGHHVWLDACILNPDGMIDCINYDGNITLSMMLKAVQGTIASVLAAENNNNKDKLPTSRKGKYNIYEMTKKEMYDFIDSHISDKIIDAHIKNNKKCNNRDDVINDITNHTSNFKFEHKPKFVSINREIMPQPWKGGSDEDNKNSASPNSKKSALWKLRKKEVMKDAIS